MKPKARVEEQGIKAKGRQELINHLDGKRLTRGQALTAKCYDCMGYYHDGKVSCRISDCPLFPFMPYRDNSE